MPQRFVIGLGAPPRPGSRSRHTTLSTLPLAPSPPRRPSPVLGEAGGAPARSLLHQPFQVKRPQFLTELKTGRIPPAGPRCPLPPQPGPLSSPSLCPPRGSRLLRPYLGGCRGRSSGRLRAEQRLLLLATAPGSPERCPAEGWPLGRNQARCPTRPGRLFSGRQPRGAGEPLSSACTRRDAVLTGAGTRSPPPVPSRTRAAGPSPSLRLSPPVEISAPSPPCTSSPSPSLRPPPLSDLSLPRPGGSPHSKGDAKPAAEESRGRAPFQGRLPREKLGNGNPIPRTEGLRGQGKQSLVNHAVSPPRAGGSPVGGKAAGGGGVMGSGTGNGHCFAVPAAARSGVQVETAKHGFYINTALLCVKNKKSSFVPKQLLLLLFFYFFFRLTNKRKQRKQAQQR